MLIRFYSGLPSGVCISLLAFAGYAGVVGGSRLAVRTRALGE